MTFDKILIRDDGEKFPYNEDVDSHGYFYQISINWKDEEAIVSITEEGCDIEFEDGRSILTNLMPSRIFRDQKRLSSKNLLQILHTLAKIDLEGKTHTSQEMEDLYNRFLNETDGAG